MLFRKSVLFVVVGTIALVSLVNAQDVIVVEDHKVEIGSTSTPAWVEITASSESTYMGEAIGTGNAGIRITNVDGPVAFQLQDLSASGFWNFTVGEDNTEFRISKAGTGFREMTVDSDGNMFVRGNYYAGAELPGDSGTELDVPDFVFAPDYELMSLADLEAFVLENRHLPSVPSAAVVASQGYLNMTEMQLRILEKVEELTLYTIAQQKTIDAQQDEIERLTARLEALAGDE